jgi:glycosyltransferase involved in cell wall biosynthesis
LTNKPKIIVVANTTWNIYNFRLHLLETLEAAGYQIVVVAPLDEYIVYLDRLKECSHIPVKHLSRKGINPFADARLFWELYKIYRREKPDIIIHYTIKPNIYGNLAAAALSIPSICVVTGLGYVFIHNGFIKALSDYLYQYSFNFARKVIFENKDDRNLFVSNRLSRSEKSIAIKGCGVNTQFYSPMPSKGFEDKFVFTFIGRLLYDKGVVEYVEAAKIVKIKYPNAVFRLLGELDNGNPAAVSENSLSEWIENHYIRYFGAAKDVRPFIAESDVIVLPSYREGMPRAILEALSMGKAVITTDTAGCRETVDEGENGFLVPSKNINALADSMIKSCELGKVVLAQMGEKSRQKAYKEFDENIINQQIMKIIQTEIASTQSF